MDSKLFKQTLAEHGYSYRSLAEELGVSPTTLSNIINDHNYPSYHLMVSICNCLELTQEKFIMIFFSSKLNFYN